MACPFESRLSALCLPAPSHEVRSTSLSAVRGHAVPLRCHLPLAAWSSFTMPAARTIRPSGKHGNLTALLFYLGPLQRLRIPA